MIFPLDVVKTRLQIRQQEALSATLSTGRPTAASPLLRIDTAANAAQTPEPASSRLGAWTVAREAYRTEGLGVFSRGLKVCLMRAFIVNSVQFGAYEWLMMYFLN